MKESNFTEHLNNTNEIPYNEKQLPNLELLISDTQNNSSLLDKTYLKHSYNYRVENFK